MEIAFVAREKNAAFVVAAAVVARLPAAAVVAIGSDAAMQKVCLGIDKREIVEVVPDF